MYCVTQAKQFLEMEAQHSAEDAAIKVALCYEIHSSSDEEQRAQPSQPVCSLTRYFILQYSNTCLLQNLKGPEQFSM
jgi:hypothetical protein